jgi:hypothetical protein
MKADQPDLLVQLGLVQGALTQKVVSVECVPLALFSNIVLYLSISMLVFLIHNWRALMLCCDGNIQSIQPSDKPNTKDDDSIEKD